MDANTIVETVRRAVPRAKIDLAPAVDSPAIYVDRESWHDVALALRDDRDLQFQFLADVLGADFYPREPRFEVVYLLASLGVPGLSAEIRGREPGLSPPKRLRVKVRVPGTDARIATVSDLWPSAGWPEREVFDMFGITFDNHPDMRRVLMPEDWEGHPLRKDYPVQIRSAVKVYAPLQLSPEEFASNIDRIRRISQETGSGERKPD
ncbi:MAG TPA: NADH-quinone oxidoreductase subunit C [Vicinamibacterales bacterium]|nr:NADH-quinone oxidoreductase subunit C [Vicinamibacterales bacterium]